MRLLLDTNALLWWREGSSRLPPRIGARIGDPSTEIVVSIASWWEIAIKQALGKLRFHEDFEDVMLDEGFVLLQISFAHLRSLGKLPQLHGDPFDRLLIAQSLAEDLPVVTSDRTFAEYGARIVW